MPENWYSPKLFVVVIIFTVFKVMLTSLNGSLVSWCMIFPFNMPVCANKLEETIRNNRVNKCFIIYIQATNVAFFITSLINWMLQWNGLWKTAQNVEKTITIAWYQCNSNRILLPVQKTRHEETTFYFHSHFKRALQLWSRSSVYGYRLL